MYIIDGYNFLYKQPQLADEHELIVAMHEFAAHFRKRVILVFDGVWEYDGIDDTRWVQLKYVADADEYIRELAAQYPNSTIITSDREIIRTVRQHNCSVIRSHEFDISVPELTDDKPDSLSDNDLDEFIEMFS
jgi:predicted RNA-binding protein with PIN domain